MQMYVAHSYEIDDPEQAVKDILQSLPEGILSKAKKNHAVGILTTHADAVSSGVVAAVCASMPFDVIGMTSLASCGDGEVAFDILTFVLLMDDTIRFATALTEPLVDEHKSEHPFCKSIGKAYRNIESDLGLQQEKPDLTIVCAPFLPHLNGQSITDCVSKAVGHTPVFGGLASDHTAESSDTYVIYNGTCVRQRLAMLCMVGAVKVKFSFASLLANNIQNKESIITSSQGTLVESINQKEVVNYCTSLGLSREAWKSSSALIPFLVDYKDGTQPLAREFLGFTEDDYAQFGGEMPAGASIYLGLQTQEGILSTAQSILDSVVQEKENLAGVMIMGCAGRSVFLGASPLAEGEKTLAELNDMLPYHHVYARGEICPTQLSDGSLQNRFHNFTVAMCMFEKNK